MCFSKEASFITTFLLYSAVFYSIINNYHKNKYFLFVMLGYILTVGIVEPLEGVIHAVYEKEKSTTAKSFTNLETALWFSLLLQPLFMALLFITLKINPVYNKYIIGFNIIFYAYTIYFYDNIRLDLIPKNTNGYTKMSFNFSCENNIWCVLEVMGFLIPIILGSIKSIHIMVLLIQQLVIICISTFLSSKTMDNTMGTLWCFLSSIGLWVQIIAKKYLMA